jgi:hypothetical protein
MSDLTLQAAVMTVAANIAFSDNTSFLLPQSTLKVAVVGGAGTVTVSLNDSPSSKGFRKYQMLSFWDGAGNTGGQGLNWQTGAMYLPSAEEALVITALDDVANTITCNFAGTVGYSGFQYSHSIGTVVAANSIDETALPSQDALNSGYPFLYVAATKQIDSPAAAGQGRGVVHRYFPVFNIYMEYTRSLIPPGEDTLNAPVYARRTQKQARQDMNAICAAIYTNRQLKINGTPQAIQLGAGNGKPLSRDWSRMIAPRSTDQFTVAADIVIQDANTPVV